jgi:zinc D-Ala-D-Ala carboxypeptidase
MSLKPLTAIRTTALTGVLLATVLAALVVGARGAPTFGFGGDDGFGPADGRIGDQTVTALDTWVPGVARLDPDLRHALQQATRAADHQGELLRVNSGWRSAAYQQHLLDQAVDQYGSYAAARRWVNTPEASTHVTGHAVDIGPAEGAWWLEQHGAKWGLCRVYANEPWHFELLTSPGGTCPALRTSAG